MDCSISSPFPHCGIFHPNSVAVAATAPSSGRNLPQIVTHILQKAFFKHALAVRYVNHKYIVIGEKYE